MKETTTLVGTANKLTVASYNAENLDPLDPAARFTTIADEILNQPEARPTSSRCRRSRTTTAPAELRRRSAADLTLQELVDALNLQ